MELRWRRTLVQYIFIERWNSVLEFRIFMSWLKCLSVVVVGFRLVSSLSVASVFQFGFGSESWAAVLYTYFTFLPLLALRKPTLAVVAPPANNMREMFLPPLIERSYASCISIVPTELQMQQPFFYQPYAPNGAKGTCIFNAVGI